MIFKEFNPNKHDTRKVAELIYSVDYRTNLKVFRSKERAVLAIETLLLSGKNNYNEKSSEDYIIDLNHHNQKNNTNITNNQTYNTNSKSIKKTNNHDNKSNYNNKYNDRKNNKIINDKIINNKIINDQSIDNQNINNKSINNKNVNNKNINSNDLNNNSKFYIILDENNFEDNEDNIVGIISLVKGKKR
ncbi:hypothetical protein [Methanobrevibacter arboriphilus]|uniref:hypothetical protein n=1 Tax=Methanobrevibacter arboriphilus TaxID=39441 RepID=UPI000A883924|nr:hypothetical protein [Methanobrevibacter arboriphilus]